MQTYSRSLAVIRRSATRFLADIASSRSSAPVTNEFSDWYNLPNFDKLDPTQITSAVQKVITDCEKDLRTLEQSKVSRWEDVFPILDSIDDRFTKTVTLASHLAAVNDSPVMREQTKAIQPHIVSFSSRIAQSKPLFLHYETVCEISLYSSIV